LHRLQALLVQQQIAFNGAMLGRKVDVLIDRPGRLPGQLGGRSPWLQAVHVEAQTTRMNRIVPVEIVEIHPNSLKGRLIETDEAAGRAMPHGVPTARERLSA
jgi:tRNA-2-methylthio-N6-dimethylallyladenosine synthase